MQGLHRYILTTADLESVPELNVVTGVCVCALKLCMLPVAAPSLLKCVVQQDDQLTF